MTKRAQREAESAALAQRRQLGQVQRALDRPGKRVDDLKDENTKHDDTLRKKLDETSELRSQLTEMEADWRRRSPADGQIRQDFRRRVEPSEAKIDAAVVRRWPDLSLGLDIPDASGDWRSYSREVEKYVKEGALSGTWLGGTEHGIDIDSDPLGQLLSADRAAAICRRFDLDFGPSPWDRWDVAAVGMTVVAGSLLDYFLVATPGAAFKGVAQRGSPVTAWMKEQSKKLAPLSGADDMQRNTLQGSIAALTTKAEQWAKVPYDVVSPKLDLTPNTHRLAAIGHDPILGLVFGVKDIIRRTYTFIDSNGAWRVIPGPDYAERGVFESLATVVVHGLSDVFTPQGLPPPGLALLQKLKVNSGFTLREGGDPVSVPNLVRHMYGNGYDLRHFAAMAIVPGFAELAIRTYHYVRTAGQDEELGRNRIRGRLKLSQMLALTHGLLASGNLVKTALCSWDPTALNYPQFLALGKQMISLVKLSSERNALIQKQLAEGWEELLAEVPEARRPSRSGNAARWR